MKKVVLKVDVQDQKAMTKIMKTVISVSGVDSIAMDRKENKLTVTGDIDPVELVAKLRKLCHAEIISVGPAKSEKKIEEPKKEEQKKQEGQMSKDEDQVKKDQNAFAELSKYYVEQLDVEGRNACVVM